MQKRWTRRCLLVTGWGAKVIGEKLQVHPNHRGPAQMGCRLAKDLGADGGHQLPRDQGSNVQGAHITKPPPEKWPQREGAEDKKEKY